MSNTGSKGRLTRDEHSPARGSSEAFLYAEREKKNGMGCAETTLENRFSSNLKIDHQIVVCAMYYTTARAKQTVALGAPQMTACTCTMPLPTRSSTRRTAVAR